MAAVALQQHPHEDEAERPAKAPRRAAATAGTGAGADERPQQSESRPFQLAALPDDALARVLIELHPAGMLAASATCATWGLAANREQLWRALGSSFKVDLPPPRRAGSSTRHSANLKRAFFSGWVRMKKAERLATERACWRIWLKLHKSDAVALVKREHAMHPELHSHPISFYSERRLAALAAWRGRVNVVKHLLAECGADVNAADELGFTPLMMASWAGRPAVVR